MGCVHPKATGGEDAVRRVKQVIPTAKVISLVPAGNGNLTEHDKNRDANRQADDLARLAEASTTEPAAMLRGDYDPELSEDSAILDRQNFAALANTVPIRHKWARWQLLYSSGRDGISLATLYRHAGKCPSVLVVRDMQQYVFGCYTSESWRIQPRYYGNGECFAFQIQPRAVFWRWWAKRMAVARNDYFQFSLPERLCLGGAPRYALSLDADLQYGSSGMSDTFGSPCLASNEDFEVGRVELWGLQ
ncbi:hypothetical protein WJX72_004617 [[Myrmecia] bisecta]|uniref:Oxidation resistance protein 1 n=1 Tax=[Myrmecia] bisecta TaxID=41462 RepID=A0AAW1NXV1_9CHLO